MGFIKNANTDTQEFLKGGFKFLEGPMSIKRGD